MASKNVRKITPSGLRAFHIFQLPNGKFVETPCTLEQYNSLSVNGNPSPPNRNVSWHSSEIRRDFSTGKPVNDDCLICENGDGIICNGDDFYQGDVIHLPVDDYHPTITGGILTADIEVPD